MAPLKISTIIKYNNIIRRTFSKLPKRALPESSFCSAVIVAAGSSQRFANGDKLLCQIDGRPLLSYTLETFGKCEAVNEIIIVTKKTLLETAACVARECGVSKITMIIEGGDTRMHSVINGVFSVSKKAKLIAVHDGARPCTDIALIEKTIKAAAKYYAAAPGVAVTSTLKKAHKPPAGGIFGAVIEKTIDRENLYEIQTPQVFRAEILKAGLANALKKGITLTDECMAAELLGVPVHITEGSRQNIKVTDIDDFEIAKAILSGARR